MADDLKSRFSNKFVRDLSLAIKDNYVDFDSDGFVSCVLNDNWYSFELKQRMHCLSINMSIFLPDDFKESIDIIWNVPDQLKDHKMSGFLLMIFPDFVERKGLDYWDVSMKALEHFTKTSSSEFAVRPFILKDKVKMMEQMLKWSHSDNYHVRRLSSEGCRSRLPWSFALPDFKKDPSLILPILNNLKNDKSEYVRKSVANNLNDISKDNVKVLIDIAYDWFGNNKNTDWIIKHGCRTALKQSVSEVLNLFGFKPIKLADISLNISENVRIGEDVIFVFEANYIANISSNIRLEYRLKYPGKNNGTLSKIFQISERQSGNGEISISKKHSFKQLSTRTYRAGKCEIEMIINGSVCKSTFFDLIN